MEQQTPQPPKPMLERQSSLAIVVRLPRTLQQSSAESGDTATTKPSTALDAIDAGTADILPAPIEPTAAAATADKLQPPAEPAAAAAVGPPKPSPAVVAVAKALAPTNSNGEKKKKRKKPSKPKLAAPSLEELDNHRVPSGSRERPRKIPKSTKTGE